MILSRSTSRRGRIGRWTERGMLLTTGVAAGALASRIDRRRRHEMRDRASSGLHGATSGASRTARRAAGKARGAAHGITAPVRGTGEIDDVTLARKVETEIFRPADAPKGKVSVNAANGVVELRGEVPDDVARSLADAAAGVGGVKDVRNLLHPPGTPAPH